MRAARGLLQHGACCMQHMQDDEDVAEDDLELHAVAARLASAAPRLAHSDTVSGVQVPP